MSQPVSGPPSYPAFAPAAPPPARPWLWPLVVAAVVVTLVTHTAAALAFLGLRATSGAGETASGARLTLPESCLDLTSRPTHATMPAKDPYDQLVTEIDPHATLVRLYSVRDDGLAPLDGAGIPRECDVALHSVLRVLVPPTVLDYVDELLVFDVDLDDEKVTDGEVLADPSGSGGFRLALSLNGAEVDEVSYLLAHEVARIISLNSSRLVPESSHLCNGMPMSHDQCVKITSILDDYLDRFWSGDVADLWDEAVGKASDRDFESAVKDFYVEHEDSFVSEYAVNDAVEDFAESFAVWCSVGTWDPYFSEVAGDSRPGAAAKVAWFGDNPEVASTYRSGCARLQRLSVR